MDFCTGERRQSGVSLTKFERFSDDMDRGKISIDKLNTDGGTATVEQAHKLPAWNLKSPSVAVLESEDMHERQKFGAHLNGGKVTRWPCWSAGDANGTNLVSSLTCSGEPASYDPQKLTRTGNREQFRVIWRRLSFEVNMSTYDKLLSKAKAFWSLGKREDIRGETGKSASRGLAAPQADMSPRDGGKRTIFANLNGHFSSGEITAILGPSGAGKTSLLNAICGRVQGYRGSLQLVGGGKHRMRLSVIPQKDYLMENLTVRENLLFASKILNMDESFDHEANILRVVRMLNLGHCLDSSTANISGGEYKRVSIGQELLKQPDILILDEPTSGLDSLNCKYLIQSLVQLIEASRRGAINPIAIVVTIHQPDVDVFRMFDRVYCMARGGRVIYDGHPSMVMDTIRQHAGIHTAQLPVDEMLMSANPANLLIEIASEFIYGQGLIDHLSIHQLKQVGIANQRGQLVMCSTEYTELTRSAFATNLQASADCVNDPHLDLHIKKSEGLSRNSFIPDSPKSSSSNRCATPVSYPLDGSMGTNMEQKDSYKQGLLVRDKRLSSKNDHSGRFLCLTKLLAERAFASNIRDPMMTTMSLLFHLSIPIVMWIVYPRNAGSAHACPLIQREMDFVSLVSNRTTDMLSGLTEELIVVFECSTMLFLSTYCFSICAVSAAALAFPLNMHILLKEVRNGWYNLHSYVMAKTIANFPFEVLMPVLSLVIIYVVMGMPSSYLHWRLWAMALVMALAAMISSTFGLVFGALCMNSVQTAIFLAVSSTLPQVIVSGFTARISRMPYALQLLSWGSLYRYTSETLNLIRFGVGVCPCDSDTNKYILTTAPTFTGISEKMVSLFTYCLANDDSSADDDAELSGNLAAKNLTSPSQSFNTSVAINRLTVDATERSAIIARLEDKEINMLGSLADLIARSFSFGQEVTGCESVRSQLLRNLDSSPDNYLPRLFGGMLALLVVAKLVLFAVVKYKMDNRF